MKWLGSISFLLVCLTATSLRAAGPASMRLHPLAWQIALEREGFSPGILDGKAGPRTLQALTEFLASRGLSTAQSPEAYAAASEALDIEGLQPTTTYTITPDDQQEVVGAIPRSWAAKAKMPRLGYADLAEAVAERFHCSQKLLAELNPDATLSRLKPGDTLTVPNIPEPAMPSVEKIRIDLAEKVMRGYDHAGRQVCLFRCSIAAKEAKRPSGTARIVVISFEPTYRFDPAMWPEVKDVKRVLMIPPGPNNPVGLCWMGLSRKGYGMHGTPNPELIGRTGSHGCFRMSNWDAIRLGHMVQVGTPVEFVH